MSDADAQRIGDRLRRLIELFDRFSGLLERIDLEEIWPIIERIIEAVDDIFSSDAEEVAVASADALSIEDQKHLEALGLDFAAIMQLIQLVVELLRALRGEAAE